MSVKGIFGREVGNFDKLDLSDERLDRRCTANFLNLGARPDYSADIISRLQCLFEDSKANVT